ncbi:unnamed protein product [Thelazia callipaeda]|uniref:Prefoldin subunit 6 n=1 Tax=Thelazia callipaeda TaxID=103827 RepID=A0A0N5CU09_THECL|nr:unnamed protein product [Thelazia callipaeda]
MPCSVCVWFLITEHHVYCYKFSIPVSKYIGNFRNCIVLVFSSLDREKNMQNRQQLEGQLTENKLVKTELDLLEDDAKVFKLIGPVLVKQDIVEAKQNVEKRLNYITAEMYDLPYLVLSF